MSRSNYSDDLDSNLYYLYRGTVDRSLGGKRGQFFLRELAEALDAMPVKRLIAAELITPQGEVCAIGAVFKNRGVDVSKINEEDPDQVGRVAGISPSMAAEIAYINDEMCEDMTPEGRWVAVRRWVAHELGEQPVEVV